MNCKAQSNLVLAISYNTYNTHIMSMMPLSLEKVPHLLQNCHNLQRSFRIAFLQVCIFQVSKIRKPSKCSSTMDTYLLSGVEYLEVCRVSGSRVYGVIVAVIYFTPAATLFVGIIVIYFIFCAYCPNLTF